MVGTGRSFRPFNRRVSRLTALGEMAFLDGCTATPPDAQTIRLVTDNLNTRSPASLYEAFEPAEAKRILDRLEFHYTPKHGSWLNMIEIEIGVLSEQCLDDRIPGEATLRREVAVWEASRNERQATVGWRFSTSDARAKLKHLYPNISESS